MPAFQTIILILTAVTTALVAGLFYAYTCSVNPGLGNLADAEYLAAMQSINKAIQNPIFFLSFFGAFFLLPLSVYQHYSQPFSTRFLLLTAAAILYIIGVMGITIFGNIPLNEALDNFDIKSATASEIAGQRVKFEKPWNGLNLIRTIASAFSLLLVIIACLSKELEKPAEL